MKKRNKIFAIIGACFMLALSCISFIVPKNKPIESAGAYYFNGGSYNPYGATGATPVYVGVNSTAMYIDNVYYNGAKNITLSAGTHTVKFVYNSVNYSNLLYDMRTFGGLSVIKDEATANDVYKQYLNYIGYLTDDFTSSGVVPEPGLVSSGLEIFHYINITGVNTDFYLSSMPTLEYKLNNETDAPTFTIGSNGSNYGASTLTYLRDVYLADDKSFYDFLNKLTITYTFTTSLASTDVYIFGSFMYGDSQNYIYAGLYSDTVSTLTIPFDWGSNSLQDYYAGAYSSGSGYYSTYWNDYYNNLYNSQLQSVTDSAYNNGYSAGFISGSDSKSILPDAIMTFASLPFSILSGLFSFDLFGFNTYTLFLSIITIFVCIYLISKIKG